MGFHVSFESFRKVAPKKHDTASEISEMRYPGELSVVGGRDVMFLEGMIFTRILFSLFFYLTSSTVAVKVSAVRYF